MGYTGANCRCAVRGRAAWRVRTLVLARLAHFLHHEVKVIHGVVSVVNPPIVESTIY